MSSLLLSLLHRRVAVFLLLLCRLAVSLLALVVALGLLICWAVFVVAAVVVVAVIFVVAVVVPVVVEAPLALVVSVVALVLAVVVSLVLAVVVSSLVLSVLAVLALVLSVQLPLSRLLILRLVLHRLDLRLLHLLPLLVLSDVLALLGGFVLHLGEDVLVDHLRLAGLRVGLLEDGLLALRVVRGLLLGLVLLVVLGRGVLVLLVGAVVVVVGVWVGEGECFPGAVLFHLGVGYFWMQGAHELGNSGVVFAEEGDGLRVVGEVLENDGQSVRVNDCCLLFFYCILLRVRPHHADAFVVLDGG